METYDFLKNEYEEWFNSLDELQRNSFMYFMLQSFDISHLERHRQMDRFLCGVTFSNFKFKALRKYYEDEIYNTFRELSKTKLSIEWAYLDYINSYIKEKIKSFDKKTKVTQLQILEEENEFALLFWIVFMSNINVDYLLSGEVIFKIKPRDYKEDLTGLWELIDFIVKYLFMLELLNYIKIGRFDEIITRKEQPKIKTFEGLFIHTENAKKVRDLLESNGYTKNKKWIFESTNKSEPAYAYYVLKPLLINGKDTPQIKVFYKEFGLPEDYISDRMKTNKPDNKNRSDFERIFSHLISK